jgi:hypothetical protein
LDTALPEGKKYGATVAVTEIDGVEVASLYGNKFTQAEMDHFTSIVEASGGEAIFTSGNVHAEQALHEAYPTAGAIGISNPFGPCAKCGEYFAPRNFFNLFWPGDTPAKW